MELDGQYEAKLLAFRNEEAVLESAKASYESELRMKYEKMKDRYATAEINQYVNLVCRYETELTAQKKHLEEYEKELFNNFQKVFRRKTLWN